jgi:putative transposase
MLPQVTQAIWDQSEREDVDACWDHAVVERFFSSLKHDWILKVPQPTREYMRKDVAAYMRYYNVDRYHSSNVSMAISFGPLLRVF